MAIGFKYDKSNLNEKDRLRVRSLFFNRIIGRDKTQFSRDFLQVGIWDDHYEYIDLEELKKIRSFINETIMLMTFKNTTNDKI